MLFYVEADTLSEVASKVPERIVSLSLIVTKPGRRRLIELPSVSVFRLDAWWSANVYDTMLVHRLEEPHAYHDDQGA